MKLNNLAEKLVTEIITTMNLVDMKVHTDDNGKVCAIELKYVPLKELEINDCKSNPWQ